MKDSENPYRVDAAADSVAAEDSGDAPPQNEIQAALTESLADLDSHSRWLLILSCVWPALQLMLLAKHFVKGLSPPASSPDMVQYQAIGVAVITVYQLFVIYGTLCMRKRSSYRWARVAAWMAMVPGMGMCFVLAVPNGWQCNHILQEPGVKESFATESSDSR